MTAEEETNVSEPEQVLADPRDHSGAPTLSCCGSPFAYTLPTSIPTFSPSIGTPAPSFLTTPELTTRDPTQSPTVSPSAAPTFIVTPASTAVLFIVDFSLSYRFFPGSSLRQPTVEEIAGLRTWNFYTDFLVSVYSDFTMLTFSFELINFDPYQSYPIVINYQAIVRFDTSDLGT